MASQHEVVLFQSSDQTISLSVDFDGETAWLSQAQMAELFGKDQSVISRHIRNAFSEGEVDRDSNMQFMHIASSDKPITLYSLDVIISVGYRVKSQRGVEFRRWATGVLKQYVIKGYVANEKRLAQLGQIVNVMDRLPGRLDAQQVLDVVRRYTRALDLLDDYDHQTLVRPQGNKNAYVLTYEECRSFIDSMRFSEQSDLFGNEKDDSFKGTLGAIYQGFGGVEIYPSIEEKAANLLYFIVKNHSFSDGNKRIAAALFLYFLDKNDMLFDEGGEKRLADSTLVAVTIMIAESKPEEKEAMISLVMNFLAL